MEDPLYFLSKIEKFVVTATVPYPADSILRPTCVELHNDMIRPRVRRKSARRAGSIRKTL